MVIKVDEKIIKAEVVKPVEPPPAPHQRRAAKLHGVTYKIKPPTMDAALYVTINHQVVEGGKKRPFEIFINTKDTSSYQWIVAVTRLLSGHFRQPQDFFWVIDELSQITDPKGGYFLPGTKKWCSGVTAHLAYILEEHCVELGIIVKAPPSAEAEYLADKKKKAVEQHVKALICPKCKEESYYFTDNCWTCVSCGESKCG